MEFITQPDVLSAIVTAIGLVVVQIVISWKQNNLLLYRIKQLEKKQDASNQIKERLAIVETQIEDLKGHIGN